MNRGRKSALITALACVACMVCLLASLPASAQTPPPAPSPTNPDVPAWLPHAVVYQIYPADLLRHQRRRHRRPARRHRQARLHQEPGRRCHLAQPLLRLAVQRRGLRHPRLLQSGSALRHQRRRPSALRGGAQARPQGPLRLRHQLHGHRPPLVRRLHASRSRIAHSNWYIWTDNAWKTEEGEFAIASSTATASATATSCATSTGPSRRSTSASRKPDPAKKWQLPADSPGRRSPCARSSKRVLRFWMDMGADGFRADMAGALVKGPGSDTETKEFWREIRGILPRRLPGGLHGLGVVRTPRTPSTAPSTPTSSTGSTGTTTSLRRRAGAS